MVIFEKVAVCFTTFEREHLCFRLIKSIRKFYPSIAIFVVNDGRKSIRCDEAEIINIDFDKGVSFKRNLIARNVPSQYTYLLFIDDDMVFNRHTSIENLLDQLASDMSLGLVSGAVYDFGKDLRPYEAIIKWESDGKTLLLSAVDGDGYCDLTQNFFLARRELFSSVLWKDELKLAEHVPFFIDVKQSGWKCFHTKSVAIEHWPEVSGEYLTYRRRHAQYQKLWMDSNNVETVIRPNGNIINRSELDDPEYWPWVPVSKGEK